MSSLANDTKPTFLRRRPATSYFVLTFALSWTAALLVAAPRLSAPGPLPKLTGILMFPAMLLGPSVCGIVLTQCLDGRDGVRELFSRVRRFGFPARFYVALLIPPTMVLCVLLALKIFVSPVYAPNRFWLGASFAILAGVLEEIGWMGFAYPKLRQRFGMFLAATVLGLMWGLWHAPVIDFLGAASPHGKALPLFFASFVAAMCAMRVLIAWFYERTQSVPLCQLIHISSTASLVVFSPPAVTPMQEAYWYGCYGAALWVVAVVVLRSSRSRSR